MTETLSVVIPVYNEEEALPLLVPRLRAVVDGIDLACELIFVDDGSRDGTVKLLHDLQHEEPRIRVVCLSRNFGHQAAVTAGMDAAVGDAVVVMDADLQDPPELIPDLLAAWREGADVVYAVRRTREGSRLKRTLYSVYYRVVGRMSDVELPRDAGDFSLIGRRALDAMRSLPEVTRYVRGLRAWVGFRQVAVAYDRPERAAGQPGYSYRKLLRLASDGITSFTSTPLRVASGLGAGSIALGLAYLAYAIVSRIVVGDVPPGWTSLLAVILLLGGLQLLVLGVIGVYLGRVYDELKRRPTYIVDDRPSTGPNQRSTIVDG